MSNNGATSVREELQAAEERYDRSIVNNSPEEMLRFYQELTTPDFVERDLKGTVTTRQQMLKMMGQLVSATSGIGYKELLSVKTTVEEVLVEGDTATAIVTHCGHYVQTDVHGWSGPPGEDIELKRADRWERVWRKSSGGWRLQSSRHMGGVSSGGFNRGTTCLEGL